MTQNLVYDIGAHKGDDTFVYLQLGYHVIAVEANTGLIDGLKQRFESEIKDGRLVILNVAVGNDNEVVRDRV